MSCKDYDGRELSVGDEVICLDNEHGNPVLKRGARYKIEKITGESVFARPLDWAYNGLLGSWYSYHFRLDDDENDI